LKIKYKKHKWFRDQYQSSWIDIKECLSAQTNIKTLKYFNSESFVYVPRGTPLVFFSNLEIPEGPKLNFL